MVEQQSFNESIERILQSKAFAAAHSSRRLLKYLADRTANEDPDLKEYSVGIDVFGKSSSYDPQRDSTVRIQVGRLRQKLTEYYGDEGRLDTACIEIPKGSFRLAISPRTIAFAPSPDAPSFWKPLAIGSLLLSIGLLAWIGFTRNTSPQNPNWSKDLNTLWHPILSNQRPLVIAFSTPLFAEFQGTMLFRSRGEESWDKLLASQNFSLVSKVLGTPTAKPTNYYAAAGEVGAAFSLARALSPHQRNISLVRDVQLSWQQLADNNVLFLGAPRFFRDKLRDLPMDLEILAESDGFRVKNPLPGEPTSFPKNGVQGDGETHALVTLSPGPGGKGRIMSFMSNDTFARQGSVQALTDPDFASLLIQRLKGPGGTVPEFYQLMLKVKLKGGVTTEVIPLLHRELKKVAN
jgi:hypothetical protein